jgi:Family of unknown function (DUF6394)
VRGPGWLRWVRRSEVVYGSFVLLAASLNFAFFVGDLDEPSVHDVRVLFAALVVNLLATGLKLGDRTHVGAVHLSASLVVDLQLLAAVVTWLVSGDGGARLVTAEVVSLSGGALLASVVSVVMLFAQLLTTSGLDR